MRLGQKNGLVRQWARKGTRPRQPKDQRYRSLIIFGAICPARGTGPALVMPWANTHAMQAHLREVSHRVGPGAHAVLLSDRAGWHTTGELKIVPPKSLLWAPNTCSTRARTLERVLLPRFSRSLSGLLRCPLRWIRLFRPFSSSFALISAER